MTIEGVCLSYFVFRLCHHAHWRLWSSTKKDIRNIFAAFLLVVSNFVYSDIISNSNSSQGKLLLTVLII